MKKVIIVVFAALFLFAPLSLLAQNQNEVYQKREEEMINPAAIGLWMSEKMYASQVELIHKMEAADDPTFVYGRTIWGQSVDEVLESEKGQNDIIFYGRQSMSMADQNHNGLVYMRHLGGKDFAVSMYSFGLNGEGLSQIVTGLNGPAMLVEDAASYIAFLEQMYEKELGTPLKRYSLSNDEITGLYWQSEKKDFMLFIPPPPATTDACPFNVQIYAISTAPNSIQNPDTFIQVLDEGFKKGCAATNS